MGSTHIRAVIAVIVLAVAPFAAACVNLSGEYWFGSLSADASTNVPWGKRGTVTVTGNNWNQEWTDYDGHHTFTLTFTTSVQPDGSVNVNFPEETYNIAWNGDVMIHADTAPDSNGRMGIDIITRKATNIDTNDVVGDYDYFEHRLGWYDRWDGVAWGNVVMDANGTAVQNSVGDDGQQHHNSFPWTLDEVNAMVNVPEKSPGLLCKGGIALIPEPIPVPDGIGYNLLIKKTSQTITPAEMAGTYQVRFLETGPGGMPYTCSQGTFVMTADGSLSIDAYYSDGAHDVADGNYTIDPANKILINVHGHISEGIISSDKGLIFAPEYDRPNPPNYYDWIGGIFLIRTVNTANDTADLNGDGVVDWLDLEILISQWLETTSDNNSGKDGDGITVVPYGGSITVDGNSVVVCNGVNDENAIREAYELSSPVLSTFHDYNNGNPVLGPSENTNNVYPGATYDSNSSRYMIMTNRNYYSGSPDTGWSGGKANGGFSSWTHISPWKEGPALWKAMCRDATVNVDYFTSMDGNGWSQSNADVLSGTSGTWDYTSLDPSVPIKVGATYYMYYNNVGRYPRSTGLATSTDLVTWTKDVNNPLFAGNRFNAALFVVDSNYYMILAHFDAVHHATGGWSAYEELELYRSKTPAFYPASREFLGVIKRLPTGDSWNTANIDCPFVYVEDSNCNTFPNPTRIEIIYSAFDNTMTTTKFGSMYAEINDINALTRAAKAKPVTILPGRYKLRNPIISKAESYTTAYGAEFEFYNATIGYGAALVSGDKAIWKGGTFTDKSTERTTYGALFSEAGGTIEDAAFYGFYCNCKVQAGLDCDVFLRRNTFGRSKTATADIYNMSVSGVRLFRSEGNTYYGAIYNSGDRIGQGVALGWSAEANNVSFDRDTFLDCAITAISVSSSANNVRVANCAFDGCGRCVDMYLGGYGLIMNNLVLNGVAARTPFNIQSGSICNRVAGNTIYTLATNGIVVASDADNTIAYNNISAAGAGVSDTSAGTTNIITGNWSDNLWPFGGYSYDTDTGSGDLNGDGIVNFEDYSIFAQLRLESVGQ